jgi:hypothetical protein
MPRQDERQRTCAHQLSRVSIACNSWGVHRDEREAASELRAVAPLVVVRDGVELVGPCTLVTNGARTVALSSAELLRQAPEPLAIALTLDGTKTVRVASWSMGRITGVGIAELAEPFPKSGTDIVPLQLASVSATVDTRGAPSALVTFVREGGRLVRRAVPVHVDSIDGGEMSDDVLARLASPDDAADSTVPVAGAALFSWMPADPVLGRPSEVVLVALGLVYRQQAFKPRANAPIAELVGLEDLGRALPWEGAQPEGSNELGQVAGEIRADESGPLAGLDLDE